MEATAGQGDGTRLERGIRMTLKSPVRRSVIRLLNGSPNPLSLEDLAAELLVPLDEIGPQLHVLNEYGLVERRTDRGQSETVLSSSWISAVPDHADLRRGLERMADDDAELLEARRQVAAQPAR